MGWLGSAKGESHVSWKGNITFSPCIGRESRGQIDGYDYGWLQCSHGGQGFSIEAWSQGFSQAKPQNTIDDKEHVIMKGCGLC
jgi:hypothetical protein